MQDGFNINEISLDGFQVVRGYYFSRQVEPSFTIWYNNIAFNSAAFNALNGCESVEILVNSAKRSIVVKPIPSTDRDAVNWIKPADTHKYRKLECSKFAHQLFEFWNWNKELHYRTNGKLVTVDKKIMLLFDFTKPEAWHGVKMVSDFD